MSNPKFNRDRLVFKKLYERKNKVNIVEDVVSVDRKPENLTADDWSLIEKSARKMASAKSDNRSVILAFGAHTIKNGMTPLLIALMRDGWITHFATNGAAIIHDWEFAYQGKSSEDVRGNVNKGEFGLWEETGFYINLALAVGAYEGLGYGESVGRMISCEGLQIPDITDLKEVALRNITSDPDLSASAIELSGLINRFGLKKGFMVIPHPYKRYSVQALAFDLGIPFTGHPMIGQDIIYCHPANLGSAIGRTALRDFLSFADSISNIDMGVYLSVGSAVMSPMIFEKSLSMAQNIKIQEKKHIDDHYMLVVDLAKADWDWEKQGEPPVDNPAYYLRFCKTFSRMGGEMHYLTADNRDFLLALYQTLSKL
ncbi:MAG TPA: hypothetical protein VMV47_07835 [Bacteroidales bacterium]|nr:hypothetical protein [Bacteroidales bacterium]